MRIDAYNQVNMVYATAGKTQLKKTAKTSTTEDITRLPRQQWHRLMMSGKTESPRLRSTMHQGSIMYRRTSLLPSL